MNPTRVESRGIPARTLIAVAVLALAQAACGGGGGGDASPTAVTPDPTTPGQQLQPSVPQPPAITSQKVSVTVSGLTGTGLTLLNNGVDALAVTADGTYTFATSLDTGAAYAVTVGTQPSAQTCAVSDGSGTIASADVTNVTIACVANTPVVVVTPTVTTVNPANADTAVSRGVAPVLSFSDNVDPSSVTASTVTLSSAAGAKSATLNTTGSSVSISPLSKLFPLTTYTVTATTGVKDASGTPLGSTFTSTFTTADGAWDTNVIGLDGSSTDTSTAPKIATDANGNAVAVWSHAVSGVPFAYYSIYTASSDSWSAPFSIDATAGGNQTNPAVAFDSAGNATAVFMLFDGGVYKLMSSTLAAGQVAFSTAAQIGLPSDATTVPQVQIDSAGNTLVAYTVTSPGREDVYAVAKPAGSSTWNSAVLVNNIGFHVDAAPKLAMDNNGHAVIGWADVSTYVFSAVSSDFGATWSSTYNPVSSASMEQVGIDNSGNALVVWTDADGASGARRVMSRRYTGTTAGLDTQVDGNTGSNADRPSFSFDPAGNALIVWAQLASGSQVYYSYAAPGAGWGAPAAVGNNVLTSASTPKVVLDQGGNGLVVFGQTDTWASSNNTYHAYSSRYLVGSNSWSTAQPIDSIGAANTSYTSSGVSQLTQLKVDATGSAFATWLQYPDGGNAQAYAARWR